MGSKIASETPLSWSKLLGWWAASLFAAWAVGWSQLTPADFTSPAPPPGESAPAARPAP